jgi:soluble lytic murein transglycosylase
MFDTTWGASRHNPLSKSLKKNEGKGMEKRHKKTLPRTLHWGVACAKVGLTVILFIPALATVKYAVPQPVRRDPVKLVEPVEKTQPRELVTIYSIVKSNRPSIADKEAWKLSAAIHDESAKRDLDPMLVLAVIKVESGFHHRALSPMGARGIMQIMPETGKYLSEELYRVDGFEPRDFIADHLDDPVLNIKLGVYYLDGLKKQFRSLSLALLAYNLGPGEIQNRLANNLHFSDQYAAVVLDAYREYKKAQTRVF